MSLDQFCEGRLVALDPDDTVDCAARAMQENHIGSVLVCRRSELHGIVTDRDLAVRVVARDALPGSVTLREVMTPDPASIDVEASPAQAAALMHVLHVRRLVVTDGRKLKGIVTLDDLLVTRAGS